MAGLQGEPVEEQICYHLSMHGVWVQRQNFAGGFDAKFDGNFYPVEDDPAHTMVMLKLLDSNTVEQTNKREGKIVSVLRLTVAPDGKTIHASYENKEDNTTTRSEMRKQDQ